MAAKSLPTKFKMAGNPIHILCTRPVDNALIEAAAAKGFPVDVIEFIHTVPITGNAIATEVRSIASTQCNVIFTSMNAVVAVKDMIGEAKPAWNIFCMGNTTKQLVIKYFGEKTLKGTGINATDLANTITSWRNASHDKSDCIFFCGDQRRDELPGILKENNIDLSEITVYQTIVTPRKVEKHYDAILFFSPSAVHSFFKTNRANDETVFYAIGETTANTIRNYCPNKIVVGATPAKDELFQQCVTDFEDIINEKQTGFNTGNGQQATSN
jgi:uroporphyrinogen-III synthase